MQEAQDEEITEVVLLEEASSSGPLSTKKIVLENQPQQALQIMSLSSSQVFESCLKT